jgi:TPR repeat protein
VNIESNRPGCDTYEEGTGANRDIGKAIEYYKKACALDGIVDCAYADALEKDL